MSDSGRSAAPSRAGLILAFLAIYVIWGSTYLAIRFAIETLPPFLMAGTRFVIAGAVLYVWMRLRGARRPTRHQWLATGMVGALLLVAGNGVVVWAEQRVTSSVVALLLAITPAWMTLLDWLRPGGVRPTRGVTIGLLMGFAGIVLLIQVPDWSSVWVVTLQSLGLAAIYAAVLGLTIITHGNSSLISELQLDQYSSGSKTPPWCVCLAATYACLAFFAGRISSKWQKVLRQVQAADQAAAHI